MLELIRTVYRDLIEAARSGDHGRFIVVGFVSGAVLIVVVIVAVMTSRM